MSNGYYKTDCHLYANLSYGEMIDRRFNGYSLGKIKMLKFNLGIYVCTICSSKYEFCVHKTDTRVYEIVWKFYIQVVTCIKFIFQWRLRGNVHNRIFENRHECHNEINETITRRESARTSFRLSEYEINIWATRFVFNLHPPVWTVMKSAAVKV